jgi:hypothetical protein
MRLPGDRWHVRLMGMLFGLGALGLGLLSLLVGDDQGLAAGQRADRHDFALVAIVTGLIALIGSLLTPDIRALWFCNPERSIAIAKTAVRTLTELLFGPGRRD